ncbi:MAG: cobalt-precorrin-5B (C(1))-methyltransferase, partial [Rhodobacteraceae bacterium]|nr:cobalt-precorrin-5B (C(1))-methyltransferase [Paracoccaceae bacterium]
MRRTVDSSRDKGDELRTGFTTGACATAASLAAYQALVSGHWLNPVTIDLPRGGTAAFALESAELGRGHALAGVRKDAGDDPDVTDKALIVAKVSAAAAGSSVRFQAGEGVGVVTLPGLPVPVGEPAINPVPRRMIADHICRAASALGASSDVVVEISVPGGAEIAKQTWNPRLGIVGGISILGTTGIVRPYSCSAWIASIHRGIDVARASGARHVVGSTGSVSEAAAATMYGLPDFAMLDMGDFVGGMLKYLRRHPVEFVSVAGGFAKLSKLANGALDLHSRRSQVDFRFLARLLADGSPGMTECELDEA